MFKNAQGVSTTKKSLGRQSIRGRKVGRGNTPVRVCPRERRKKENTSQGVEEELRDKEPPIEENNWQN